MSSPIEVQQMQLTSPSSTGLAHQNEVANSRTQSTENGVRAADRPCVLKATIRNSLRFNTQSQLLR
jgi:hypothetical protein